MADTTSAGGAANCLTANGVAYNSLDPKIATNSTTSQFWITHPMPVNGPNSTNNIQINYGYIACGAAGPQPVTNTWNAPPPCDPNAVGQCTYGVRPDGTVATQDEWEPTIGFAIKPGSPPTARVEAYWYSTNDDISNHAVSVYATYSENGGAFQTPVVISAPNYGTSQTLPWTPLAVMYDYNEIGVDTTNGRFLAVWGGDNRTGVANIQSELAY